MSIIEIGNYKRVVTYSIISVPTGSPKPNPTDTLVLSDVGADKANADVYVHIVSIVWTKIV